MGTGCRISVNDAGDVFIEAVESEAPSGGTTPPVYLGMAVVEAEAVGLALGGSTTPPVRPGMAELLTLPLASPGFLAR